MKTLMKKVLAGTIIATGVITTLPIETETVEAAPF